MGGVTLIGAERPRPYERPLSKALLLATGSRPRRLPGPDLGNVHRLRTLDDAERLIDLSEGVRLTVVGSDWIGLEAPRRPGRRAPR